MGGVGIDLSKIRPDGAKVNNAAETSTGIVTILDQYSSTTINVAQNGRRGAMMVSLSVRHPDILGFIKIKRDLTKITGANISLMMDDSSFMMKVIDYKRNGKDSDYVTRFPIDLNINYQSKQAIQNAPYGQLVPFKNGYIKKYKISEIWDEFVQSNWQCADPGIIFKDVQDDFSPSNSYEEFRNITTNPCITGDTLVITSKGLRPIKDIQVGEYVLSRDCKSKLKAFKLVTASAMTRANAKVIRCKFAQGGHLDCTPDHKVWDVIKNDWVEPAIGTVILKPSTGLTGSYSYQMQAYRECYAYWLGKKGKSPRMRGAKATEYKAKRELFAKENAYWLIPLINDLNNKGIGRKVIAKQLGITNMQYVELVNYLGIGEKGNLAKSRSSRHYIRKQQSHCIASLYEHLTGCKINSESDGCYGNAMLIKYSDKYYYAKSQAEATVLVDLLKSDNLAQLEPEYTSTDGRPHCHADFLTKDGRMIEVKSNDTVHPYSIDPKCELIVASALAPGNNYYDLDNNQFHKIDWIYAMEDRPNEDVYDLTVQDNHNFYTKDLLIHNCSEIMMGGEDSCRLLAINLTKCVKDKFVISARIDKESVFILSFIGALIGDCIVDEEAKHVDRIINKVKNDDIEPDLKQLVLNLWIRIKEIGLKGRRIGLGLTGLGDVYAYLGRPYGDFDVNEQILNQKSAGEWLASVALAECYGAFPGWDPEVDSKNAFFDRLTKINPDFIPVFNSMIQVGRRNISISTCAPNGSTSIITQTTSGIEPVFMAEYKRRRKVSENKEYDIKDKDGCCFKEYIVRHKGLQDWMNIDPEDRNSKENPYAGNEAQDLDYVRRVKNQGQIQQYVSHSISSTVNLPNDVSPEVMSDIYILAWENKLKGITCYRDGSKMGVMVAADNSPKPSSDKKWVRPEVLDCKIIRMSMNGESWMAYISILDGKPVEVFTGKTSNGVKLDKSLVEGKIRKVNIEDDKHRYDLEFVDSDGFEFTVKGINRCFNSEFYNYSKMVSSMLQNGFTVEHVCRVIERLDLGDEINGWKSAVVRALRKYIKSGTIREGETCPNCGEKLQYVEGCVKCINCGWTKCGL